MFLSLYLITILFISVAPVSLAQNQIDNPSFEAGEGETAKGWGCIANKGNPGFARTDEKAYEGKYSAKLTVKPEDIYARWVYSRPDLFQSLNIRDKLRLRFKYMVECDQEKIFADALIQVEMDAAPGWRHYGLEALKVTGAKWLEYEAETIIDVIPNGRGEVQLRGSIGKGGDWAIYFDDVSLEIIPAKLPQKPQPFIAPKGNQSMLTPEQIHAIQCDTSILPLRTAAEELQKYINNRQIKPLKIEHPADAPPLQGTLVLGTPADNPMLARWAKEGKLGITEYSDMVDAYEIAELEGCVAIVGTNPRSALYGVFELEDLLIGHGGLSRDFYSRAKPNFNLRLLHPRARGGFYGYQQNDIEYIARAVANIAHLSHDWMSEKTLFSFTPCPEFPDAIDPTNLESNRKQLHQYIQWCKMYGLRAALWLCEIICQGGGWVPESTRQAFLNRFPAEVLEDTGTYQGKVLCLAHPLVEKAYRGMVRQLLADFPEIEMLLIFTLDSNGEFCHPDKCPRHKGISKYTQYNSFLRLLLKEGRKIQPDFKVFSIGWSWMFRNDPEYLTQFSERI